MMQLGPICDGLPCARYISVKHEIPCHFESQEINSAEANLEKQDIVFYFHACCMPAQIIPCAVCDSHHTCDVVLSSGESRR